MRGGKREGAGRPLGTDKKIRSLRLSDMEYDKVREYVIKLREAEKMLEGIRSYVEDGKYYQVKLSFDEFYNEIIFEGGVSRYDPEIGVSFALLKDKDGKEIFYAECDNSALLEKAGLDGSSDEDCDKCQDVIEKHDDVFLENAYKAYLSGETVYRE